MPFLHRDFWLPLNQLDAFVNNIHLDWSLNFSYSLIAAFHLFQWLIGESLASLAAVLVAPDLACPVSNFLITAVNCANLPGGLFAAQPRILMAASCSNLFMPCRRPVRHSDQINNEPNVYDVSFRSVVMQQDKVFWYFSILHAARLPHRPTI